MLAALAQYHSHVVREELSRNGVVGGQNIDHSSALQVSRLFHQLYAPPNYGLPRVALYLFDALEHFFWFFVELGK